MNYKNIKLQIINLKLLEKLELEKNKKRIPEKEIQKID